MVILLSLVCCNPSLGYVPSTFLESEVWYPITRSYLFKNNTLSLYLSVKLECLTK